MSFTKFTKPRFLLCEGDDDKGVFESLISARGLPEFQVCHAAECNPSNTGGRSGFSRCIRGIEPISGFQDLKALLIVTDNDVQGTAFGEAQNALSENGYTAPKTPEDLGSIVGKPVLILMIPRPDIEGNLELLSLPAIHDKWPHAEDCVETFLRCTGATAWTKSGSLHKARARAVPVGCNEPDPFKGIGHLFRNGTLSTTHPCFDEVAEFIRTFDARAGI